MENITRIGVDLSKLVFHLYGVNHAGRMVFKKRVYRDAVLRELSQAPQGCEVVMESCGSSHYWAREIEHLGYRVRQIPAVLVRPFVKSQKNDFNDAEAICEAASRPSMRFVPTKSVQQQDLQALHRIRERLVGNRTALINQLRGLLSERGLVFPQGATIVKKAVRNFLETEQANHTYQFFDLVTQLHTELCEVEQKILSYEKRLKLRARECPTIRRLLTIPGIGVLTATAIMSACGDPKVFKNGRHFAASLGLVPKQDTTGGKPRLLGITKRGDVYLRKLLIHGARAVLRHVTKKTDKLSLWVKKLCEKKGTNLTAVALANKNARIAWRLLTSNEVFDPALPHAA